VLFSRPSLNPGAATAFSIFLDSAHRVCTAGNVLSCLAASPIPVGVWTHLVVTTSSGGTANSV
jgi:hypothetical protein